MRLISHGAAETVTGSCHLLEIPPHFKLLVDCGMFQGLNEELNYQPFGFNPREIKLLLVTHAHLDHVGRIPLLVKQGFDGRIVTTRATWELMEIVLLDSAKLMEEDYRTQLRKARRRGEEDLVPKPLYTQRDVHHLFETISVQFAEYNKPVRLTEFLTATFRNASHILGSATISLHVGNGPDAKTLVFSGDLGNRNDPVLPPPDYAHEADALFIESTYGDRNHRPIKDSIEEFRDTITRTLKRGGNVIIPSFAIERTQEVLCILRDLERQHRLPPCAIFVDSPMATRATQVYDRYPQLLSRHCAGHQGREGIFDLPNLMFTEDTSASRAINTIERGAIIIAGSGMCNGGRILHHLKHRLWNQNNSVIFVGYQAQGTLGRKLVEGAQWVRIYNEDIRVKAEIVSINGFSAHADQREMLDWMKHFRRLEQIFLIHGEIDKMHVFRAAILKALGKCAHIVRRGESIWLGEVDTSIHPKHRHKR